MDNRHFTQPIVIRETSSETQSKDLAAIIQAASKSNSVLSSVWFRKVEPRFALEPLHVAVSVVFLALASFILAIMLNATAVVSFAIATAVAIVSAVAIVAVSFRNANTTEYEVAYESSNQANVTKTTYKIDITKGTQTNFVDLPAFFDATAVGQLVKMADHEKRFNVRNVVDYGVCKQQEFSTLRDKLALAQMLEKSGKTWELTDAFFAFADEVSE